MKKKIFSLVLALMMLMNIVALMPTANAATFSDVPDNHWAKSYIEQMQGSNIINGYEDGTFKPEKEVKVGEFIKMATLCIWKIDPNERVPFGKHWVTPYANMANNVLVSVDNYTYDDYERYITRREAAEIIWKMYRRTHENVIVDNKGEKLKEYSDESTIVGEEARKYFEYCIQLGLINGFDDGTLRPTATLTRAQATKLLSVAK